MQWMPTTHFSFVPNVSAAFDQLEKGQKEFTSNTINYIQCYEILFYFIIVLSVIEVQVLVHVTVYGWGIIIMN